MPESETGHRLHRGITAHDWARMNPHPTWIDDGRRTMSSTWFTLRKAVGYLVGVTNTSSRRSCLRDLVTTFQLSHHAYLCHLRVCVEQVVGWTRHLVHLQAVICHLDCALEDTGCWLYWAAIVRDRDWEAMLLSAYRWADRADLSGTRGHVHYVSL